MRKLLVRTIKRIKSLEARNAGYAESFKEQYRYSDSFAADLRVRIHTATASVERVERIV